MGPRKSEHPTKASGDAGLLVLLKPYSGLVATLVTLTILANSLNLVVPKLMSHAIDTYTQGTFALNAVVVQFLLAGLFIFILTYFQSIVQTYASERVAKDLRTRVAAKISAQSYAYVEKVTPAKLLTNLTSDVDGVKLFVSQAVFCLKKKILLSFGARVFLLATNAPG